MSKGDCQYTGKICYHAGLPESWNCSPKSRQKWNLKVAVFNFSPPIFLVSCSSQPLVHITSLKLVLSGFLPVKANAQFSVLILLDLVIGLRWLFFSLFHHWSSRPSPYSSVITPAPLAAAFQPSLLIPHYLSDL